MKPFRFGTDGVRGRANEWPLTQEGARAIGSAVATWCGGSVVVGWDTRESSPALAEAVLEGIAAAGQVALRAGVLPTPALSCAVPGVAAAGVMVTASHNPWEDNGIKVVGADGRKVFDPAPIEAAVGTAPVGGGSVVDLADAARTWRAMLPRPELGQRILVDCANGAATAHAPAFLESLGARVSRRGCAPDGRNINAGVGALHPPERIDEDLAICVDGDGDRLAIVDRSLGLLDGDDLLYFLAGAIAGPVVGTVMTNGGLERALGPGRLVRAPVGDRFVAEAMRATGARIGGEPSGHLLFADGLPTSCGLYTALRAMAVPWKAKFARLPQVTVNVRATKVGAADEIARAERAGHRVVVRTSGTEPVVRVMVEGEEAKRWADEIARAL